MIDVFGLVLFSKRLSISAEFPLRFPPDESNLYKSAKANRIADQA